MASLAPLPPCISDLERDVHCRLLRLPGRAIPLDGIIELSVCWGWPALTSVRAMATAERSLVAIRSEEVWRRRLARALPARESVAHTDRAGRGEKGRGRVAAIDGKLWIQPRSSRSGLCNLRQISWSAPTDWRPFVAARTDQPAVASSGRSGKTSAAKRHRQRK